MGRRRNIFAESIKAGSASYSLRALIGDIEAAIDRDEILKEHAYLYINLYLHIIRMMASGHDSNKIIYSLNKQVHLNMPEKIIRFHISRVKSNYKEFVEIMEAIFYAKQRDFIKMGASDEQAIDCCNEWLTSEFF
jgi:hypothetical protein